MTRLVILGLLRQPMHGYEIQQYIQQSGMEMWADVLSGSIYYALNKMEEEGLVRAEAEEQTGSRLRKIFAITERGEEAFRDLLRKSLTIPPHSLKSDFSLAIGRITSIPEEEQQKLVKKWIVTFH